MGSGFLVSLVLSFLVRCSLCPCEHIHHSWRLYVIEPHKEVSGRVMSVEPEVDGDYHINLKIQDLSLLSDKNIKNEDTCLVVEVICAHASIFSACKNYKNNIPIPSIGDSIKVIGPYVNDWIHGLREIHPVDSLIFL